MKFEQLEQLIKIKDCGSISKAAVELHVAQSTLSASIKSLEDELGCQLIERGHKGVSLTPKGTEVYNQGKTICEQVYNMKKALEKKSNEEVVLSIANNYSVIGKDMFIELYNQYNKKHKHCKFKMMDYSLSRTIKNVASGAMEIGLIRFPEINKEIHMRTIKREGLEYHRLESKLMCVVIGEKNPFYKMEANTIKLEHLTQYPFAGYYSEEADVLYEKLLPRNKRKKENISIASVTHLKEVIRRTDAFTLDVYKEKDFNSEWYEGLRYIPVEPKVYCEFGWICQKDKTLSVVAEDYIEMLQNHFQEYWANKNINPFKQIYDA